MTKRLQSKYKIDRRLGQNIWGRPKSPVNRREYGPGQHGQRRKGKPTDFGTQLKAKQKLKGYYGNISEKQFRKYYAEAIRQKGDSSQNLVGLLERRLDMVVYRCKFVPTIFAARQFVNHGHIRVNGRRVNIASYQIKVGDTIEVKESSRQLAIVIEAGSAGRARRARLLRARRRQEVRQDDPGPGPDRGALPGPDGTQPRDRVLLALSVSLTTVSKPGLAPGFFVSATGECVLSRRQRLRADDRSRFRRGRTALVAVKIESKYPRLPLANENKPCTLSAVAVDSHPCQKDHAP